MTWTSSPAALSMVTPSVSIASSSGTGSPSRSKAVSGKTLIPSSDTRTARPVLDSRFGADGSAQRDDLIGRQVRIGGGRGVVHHEAKLRKMRRLPEEVERIEAVRGRGHHDRAGIVDQRRGDRRGERRGSNSLRHGPPRRPARGDICGRGRRGPYGRPTRNQMSPPLAKRISPSTVLIEVPADAAQREHDVPRQRAHQCPRWRE